MINNIEINKDLIIKIISDKIIYCDPYLIDNNSNDADIIFITHTHYDHLSLEDISKVNKDNTIYIIPKGNLDKLDSLNIPSNNIIEVLPNNNYKIGNISFSTIPSYNTNKSFHKREYNWVGYVMNISDKRYYIAGDTDITDEAKNVKCDIAFLPIGGVYTMTYEEAASLANTIVPSVVIPIHYGSVVGTKEDAIRFKELVNSNIQVEILIK